MTFKEWLLFSAGTYNDLSDSYDRAGQEGFSYAYAGVASAYKELAKSKWAERYDAMKEKENNTRLIEALQALYDAQVDTCTRQEWKEAMKKTEEALAKARGE